MVGIVQAQLDQAARGGGSRVSSEQRSEIRVKTRTNIWVFLDTRGRTNVGIKQHYVLQPCRS